MSRSLSLKSLIAGLFLVCFAFHAYGAEIVQQFQKANEFYREGKYDQALNLYEELAKQEKLPEVYYNLGNSYFKTQKVGLAVLNYERAKRLKPRERDISTNLLYVNKLIEYKIEDKRSFYLKIVSDFLRVVTFKECLIVAVSAYFLFTTVLFLSLFSKRKSLTTGIVKISLGLVLLFALPLILKAGTQMSREAVVISNKTEVRYGPSSKDRIAFRLVEGLKVSVQDEKKDWYRIQLRDGRSGWVSQSQTAVI